MEEAQSEFNRIPRNDDNLLLLDNYSFGIALAHQEYLLVEVYSPKCPHCRNYSPIYKEAVKALKPHNLDLEAAMLNGDLYDNKDFLHKYKIKGYPTTLLFR